MINKGMLILTESFLNSAIKNNDEEFMLHCMTQLIYFHNVTQKGGL